MINFMELGTTTFEEGIAGGMDPGAAAQAAGQLCGIHRQTTHR